MATGRSALCKTVTVRFVSKNNKSLTERFPDLQGITKSIKAETAVLDGEIVALDTMGLPCFDGLRSRRRAAECVIVFYAFDLLYLDAGNSRKALLFPASLH